MMHGGEKSDLAIVAGKPANEAVSAAEERVEPRAGAEGNASGQNTPRIQSRDSVSQAPARVRTRRAAIHPRWEPYALIGHVRICAGGAQQ